jgi:hypothetical protein
MISQPVRLALAMALAIGPVLALSGESVINVSDGIQVKSLARLVGGRWVGERWCTTDRPLAADARARLTVTGGLRQLPIQAVVPGSQEWLRLAPTIIELFERREREQRLSDRTTDAPRAVDWMFVTEDGGRRMYYFEASRRVSSVSPDVDHDTDPPGTVRISVAGFLHDDQGRLTPIGTKSELRWEQDGLPAGPSRPDLVPLGVVSHRGRSIWVMKGRSGANGWFTLYDVSSAGTRTVLTARAERC